MRHRPGERAGAAYFSVVDRDFGRSALMELEMDEGCEQRQSRERGQSVTLTFFFSSGLGSERGSFPGDGRGRGGGGSLASTSRRSLRLRPEKVPPMLLRLFLRSASDSTLPFSCTRTRVRCDGRAMRIVAVNAHLDLRHGLADLLQRGCIDTHPLRYGLGRGRRLGIQRRLR